MSAGTTIKHVGWLFAAVSILSQTLTAVPKQSAAYPQIQGFVDHGMPVRVSEARGVVATCDANGTPIIIAVAWGFCDGGSRSSLLVIDAITGQTGQYYYPDEKSVNASSYGFALSEDRKFFYTMFANYFLEFDINQRKWTYSRKIEEGSALAFTITPDGTVYGGLLPVYSKVKPAVRIFSFNPKTRQFTDPIVLDDQEEQPWSLAADKSGWVYAGIGPARSNLVGFNPKTKKVIQLLRDDERKTGTGSVYPGIDGKVYAQSWISEAFGAMAGPGADPKSNKGRWYQLFEGSAIPLDHAPTVARNSIKAYHWGTVYSDFPDGRNIVKFNLSEKWADIQDKNQKIRRLHFNYKQEGAAITAVVSAPDGKVYGTTCHPMHFFAYDPQKNSIHDFGGLDRVMGGSFANFQVCGSKLISAAYSSGWIYSFDIAKPWNAEKGSNPNPRFMGEYPREIGCPEATLLYPDGRHVIFAGFPDYGYVGGGMVILDLDTERLSTIANHDIIAGQSTLALKVLPDGNLIAGTSPNGGHGGHAIAKEGLIYIMDWKTKKVTFSMVPAKGGQDVYELVVAPDGLVHGLAGPTYFVFDPATKKVTSSQDMSELGIIGRWYAARTLLVHDGSIYGLFKKAIIKIDPKTFRYEKLCILPASMEGSWANGVTGGLHLLGDRLYFSASTNLYSCPLKSSQK